MRWALCIAAFVLSLAPTALASEPLPVFVTVTGEGSIRVLLTSGATVPCDSSSNVVLFDGKLEAGNTYAFQSASPIVCERHTRGSLREVDWSSDRLWGLRRTITGTPPPWRLDIPLDTNR